jgi:pimeloyl-ACP methyl ester carboxylesterase
LKKVLRWGVFIIGIIILLLYIGLPVGMGIAAVWPSREAVGPAPEGFKEITLQTGDGENLKAWYRSPENGAAIILLHGAGNLREGIRSYIQMFTDNGYGVLALDLRGHGESTGPTNKLGWLGSRDVGAAVEFLQNQENIRQIGGLGISMGGEVLLGAVSQYPALKAVAADGATRRCNEELLALPSERPLARNFTARVMYAAVQLFGGQSPPQPTLLDSMIEARDSRFLWIAAGNNALEVEFNRLFTETLGERGELWVAPGVAHIGAFRAFPVEYEERVIGFFDQNLMK